MHAVRTRKQIKYIGNDKTFLSRYFERTLFIAAYLFEMSFVYV